MTKRKIGIWMYQNGGGDIIQQKIEDGLRQRGIETISGLNLLHAYADSEGIYCNGVKMDELDLFFSYNAGEQTIYQMYLLGQLSRFIPVVNNFSAFSLTEDKFRTQQVLRRAGIPTTDIALCHREDQERVEQKFDAWGGNMIYKPVDGWGGIGLIKVETRAELEVVLRHVSKSDLCFFYLERYIQNDGTDFRVDVVDGEAVSFYGRRAPTGDWRTNVTSGGSVFLRERDDRLRDLAERAAKATGLEIAGVDILYDQEREEYVLLEINGIPAFATPEQEAMGLDFNQRKIDRIVDLIDRKTAGAANKRKYYPLPAKARLPRIGLFYLDNVLRFFNRSNFPNWPDPIEIVQYHWGDDHERFVDEIKRKKLEVLIGNVPATAYDSFLEIQKALPGVRFVPSMESQFCNKSKENVTLFCREHALPIPETEIFYNHEEGFNYLKQCSYPRIIKRSFGASNYGGNYVHKVDSYEEALRLLEETRYDPFYIQQFIPLEADIRVMLIGHKPVCAFWRRPGDGGWLTNTSQGGSMDYQGVPKAALDLAIKTSTSSGAEYWGVDIAVQNGRYHILECATAFAAFPYIRDWIGDYLTWELSNGLFPFPEIPLYNWEQLGRLDREFLRNVRHLNVTKLVADAGEPGAQLSESA